MCHRHRRRLKVEGTAAYASRTVLPLSTCKARFRPAGLASTGRASNPLDRYKRFQSVSSSFSGFILALRQRGHPSVKILLPGFSPYKGSRRAGMRKAAGVRSRATDRVALGSAGTGTLSGLIGATDCFKHATRMGDFLKIVPNLGGFICSGAAGSRLDPWRGYHFCARARTQEARFLRRLLGRHRG
jgi:hypothetical protein